MALEIKLNQKLSQSLVMTPQLQQAIKLLQLGRLEYLEMLQKELLENPVLEDAREEEDLAGLSTAELNSLFEGEVASLDEFRSLPSINGEAPRRELDRARESGLLSERSDGFDDFDSYILSGPVSSRSSRYFEDDEDFPPLEATVSKPEGLAGHLLWQLRVSEMPAEDRDIAAQIIGNLDRNGYLTISVSELGELCGRSPQDVERVLKVVQSLDPPGVGARDLRECLLIQLDQLGYEGTLAYRIVDAHLRKLETRRYDEIARDENVPLEAVLGAVKTIQKLEPRPGRPFIDEAPVYITPDIYVRRVGDDYVILLNDGGMPKLRLSNRYRELLAEGNGFSPVDRSYVRECLKSAAWLIKSIHQRQRTIYRVTESIMKFQREFLDKGVSHLRPLVLRDVAEDVGMHESTISRVTTNKYVHTPQGVFELRFFFTSGLKSDQGEVSSESVKQRIRELIGAEDPKHPLSDQTIVEKLRAEGIDIARRTVAKYREAMNILSSSRRKRMV